MFHPLFCTNHLNKIIRSSSEQSNSSRYRSGRWKSKRNLDVFKDMSPIFKVKEGVAYPPFLLVQGNNDEPVPYEQSLPMFHKLCDCGADSQMIEVDKGPHEGTFWSQELLDLIFGFIMERL
ncbi:prolyl oligopeptidase family serine peptidase [Neobacillus drentensis]|uniref:prolyl oligopeptidase family serine peptidase n=1 Tax=Neobacillus drentensis TaxID=220684 RepID=UPI0030008DE3